MNSKKILNLPVVALGAYISLSQPNNAATAGKNSVYSGRAEIAQRNVIRSIDTGTPFTVEAVPLNLTTSAARRSEEDAIASFELRADRWEKETGIYSSPGATYLHRDYIGIIGAGMADKKLFIPLILDRASKSGADWFFALENITGENPAVHAEDFNSALGAWQVWAAAKGYVMSNNEVFAS